MTQLANLTELVKRSFVEMMKDVGTTIPGHVVAFDPDTQLAQVQIGIVRTDVKGISFDPPPLIEVPVYFAGGSFVLEHQIDPNDEGIIVFSQRCIDGWVNTGGIAENPIMRFHDFSDAMFLPGLRSQPNKIESFANNGVRLRNEDGSHYVWLKNDGTIESTNGSGTITIASSGVVTINGVTFSTSGLVTSPDDMIASGISVKTHGHQPGTYVAGPTPVTGIAGTPT